MSFLQIRDLLGMLKSWGDAYDEWPRRLTALQTAIESGEVRSGFDVVSRDSLLQSVASWATGTTGDAHPADLARIVQEAVAVVERARTDRTYDQRDSLCAHLHQKIQSLFGLLTSFASFQSRVRTCRGVLNAALLSDRSAWILDIDRALGAVDGAFAAGSLRDCRSAVTVAITAGSRIPLERVAPAFAPVPEWAIDWTIVVVEDDEFWRVRVGDVLLAAKTRLHDRNIEFFVFGDRKEAQDCVSSLLQQQDRRVRRRSVLLVADIGLPAAADDLAAPGRTEGLELLRWTREKSLGLPIVVLTTGANALEESQLVRSLGISDYFLKDRDSLGRLQESVESIIGRANTLSLRLLEGRSILCVAEVEIQLAPYLLRLVSALLEKRQATAADLAEIMRDAAGAVSPATVDKYVFEFRRAAEKAFQRVGRSIDAARELLVTSSEDERFVYRLLGSQVDVVSSSAEADDEFRVLVVEDDEGMWQRPVVELLNSRRYPAVGASTVSDAVTTATAFHPHAVCLDLQVPLRPGQAPDPSAGSNCLAQLREQFPKLGVIVLTSFADEDSIREKLIAQRVEFDDIVRKGVEWQGELICRVHRLQRQAQRVVVLPLQSTRYVLELKFLFDSENDLLPHTVEAFGKKWGLTELKRRYLWALAKRGYSSVQSDQVAREVYPDDEKPDSTKLNQLRNSLRDQIALRAVNWFGLSVADAQRVKIQILAKDHSLEILNARTETNLPPLSTRSIEALQLPPAISRRLHAAGITTVATLCARSDDQIQRIVGRDEIDKIMERLEQFDLALAADE